MLTIFRRHVKDCPHTKRRYRRCACPIHVEGSLRGEKVRRSLDLTSWEAASDLIAQWNASGEIGVVKAEVPTVKEAVRKFLEDLEVGQQRKPATVKKQAHLLEKRLLPWCAGNGKRLLKQLDVDAVTEFRKTWPDSPISAQKNLERLRAFLWFCKNRDWIRSNPASAVKAPKIGKESERVKTFTEEQVKKILAACDRYPSRNSYGHDNPERVRAFVLTLRYSGLRIGDVVGLRKGHLQEDRLFLRTQKSGESVFVPLPEIVVEALKTIQNGSEHFFWTGNGLRKSAVADWQRSLRRVFAEAEVEGNPHMFRQWPCRALHQAIWVAPTVLLRYRTVKPSLQHSIS